MIGNSTVYDVNVRYSTSGNARQEIQKIAKASEQAAQKSTSLRGALAGLGAGLLLSKAKNVFVDFNSQMESLKINMSTIMQLQLKMPFEKANKEADKLFNTFQELAKKSPATTKDFAEMASAIAAPVAMLGGGPDKLAKLTQGAIIAGQAFGERADIVALDIKQMLMGTISSRDRVAQQLIASQGMSSEQFNSMDAKGRATFTENVLQSQPLKLAADAMGESFTGQVSTFTDGLQIALGQVGKPLMVSMSQEVKRWNTWIEKHPRTIAKISSELSGMLTKSFAFIRDAASWLVDNRETLMTLAKYFLIFKGAQMGANVISSFVGGIRSIAQSMTSIGQQIAQAGGGLTGAFNSLGSFITGPGGLVAAFTAAGVAMHWMVNDQKKLAAEDAARRSLGKQIGDILKPTSDRDEYIQTLKDRSKHGVADSATIYANNDKIANSYAGADPTKYGTALRALAAKADDANGDLEYGQGYVQSFGMDQLRNGFAGMLPDTFAGSAQERLETKKAYSDFVGFLKTAPETFQQQVLEAAFPERFGKAPEVENTSSWVAPPTKSEVNVTISKIEVASDDPDRFVHGLVSTAEQIANNPTQARSTISGGF